MRSVLARLDSSASQFRRRSHQNRSLATKVQKSTVPKSPISEQLVEDLGKQLGVQKLDDWYKFTLADALRALPQVTPSNTTFPEIPVSLAKMLRQVYPSHEWIEWRFKRVPTTFWNDLSNQRAFLDWFAKQNGIDTMEKWYKVKVETIDAAGGNGFLSHKYRKSLPSALSAVYPEHQWKIWKFPRVPRSFWKLKTNQRAFLDDCAVRMGLKSSPEAQMDLSEWYRVDPKQIVALDGESVLALHQKSMILALIHAYSEHEWKEWLFTRTKVPQNFWSSPQNRRRYMDWLARERLGFDPEKEPERWYKVTHGAIHQNFGGGLISLHYNDSVPDLVSSVYPEHEWLEWMFEKTRDGWWASIDNQIKFLEHFAKKRGLRDHRDWESVDSSEIRHAGGTSLLMMYGGSLVRCLQQCYPDVDWNMWGFSKIPSGVLNASTPEESEKKRSSSPPFG